MTHKKQKELQRHYDEWKGSRASAEADPSVAETQSGIPVAELYTPLDLGAPGFGTEFDYVKKLGFPGELPFTRGIQPNMYRGRLWTMRQYAGFGSAKDTNRRFHYLLQAGQTGLSVAFDLPTQMGYDPDQPLSAGEVGKVGVSIASVDDMETLFQGIPLDRVSTSMTINATAIVLLAMYVALADKNGVARKSLSGTVQNDVLKEYVARGTYIFPPGRSMRLTTDIFAFCREELPSWNTISVSGYHIREAGSTAVQEIAFTFANAIAYVEAAVERGLEVDEFAPRISFFFNAHNNFFEEIAKFRAARRLWAEIMTERFGAKDPACMRLRFHTQTAGSTLTAQQPENNVVRVAFQALSAVLGGTQSLHTNSFDEALGLPSESAVRIALRTQQLIANETRVGSVIDPVGGSYFVEWLTDRIEEKVWDYITRIDHMGGAVKAIEQGFMQNEIHESAYRHQKAVEKRERVVVGVNKYEAAEPPARAGFEIDPAFENEQKMRLAALRAGRGPGWKEALSALDRAAAGQENLFPSVLACVKAKATLGEICDALRARWGEYRPGALAR
jgi:methylmalonyl-CoA mutase N-terminal domain/subunit